MTALISEEQWKELAKVANFKVKVLAGLRKLSVRQLQRTFRKQFDRTPQAWLKQQRLAAAKQMLLSGEPVKRVALELGFKQPSHFCKQFKLVNGLKPSQFVSGFHRSNENVLRDGADIGI
jgi:transcriptional regulator GlxA family with amidase domain